MVRNQTEVSKFQTFPLEITTLPAPVVHQPEMGRANTDGNLT